MLLSLILSFIRAEWRYITGAILVIGLYVITYNRGYHSCEEDIAIARQKATQEAQIIAAKQEKILIDNNKKEIERSKLLEGKLNAVLTKNKQYSTCIVTPDVVQILNRNSQ